MFRRFAAILLLIGIVTACGVGTDPLEVTGYAPIDGATDVPVGVTLSATFNRSVDAATVDGAFTLTSAGGDVAGTVAYDDATFTATFDPASDLAYGTEYTATASGTIEGSDGGTLGADVSWTFTTEDVVDAIGGMEVTPASSGPLAVDDTVQLDVTFTGVVGSPDTSVTWASSDDAVASVDGDGLVTANGAGTATITVTSVAFPAVSATAEVTVEGVTGVTVTPATATLAETDTQQFDATVDVVGGVGQTVTWSSSDPAVASVDAAGLVTANAPGVATITATSDADTAISGSAEITVEGVTAVDVTPASAILILTVDDTVQLDAAVTAFGGVDEGVTWTSGDDGVATVDGSGLVTAEGEGTVTITAASVVDGTVEGTAEITVTTPLVGANYLADVDAGTFVSLASPVTGGLAPFTYTELAPTPGDLGLATGLALDAATGEISGTPTDADYWRATIEVTDAAGQSVEVLAEIDVFIDLAYASSTYGYTPGATGVVVPGSDATVEGADLPLTYAMSLIGSNTDPADPAPDPDAFTIDASTGEITRVIASTPDTTSWTYEVTVTDDSYGTPPDTNDEHIDTFVVTLEALP